MSNRQGAFLTSDLHAVLFILVWRLMRLLIRWEKEEDNATVLLKYGVMWF